METILLALSPIVVPFVTRFVKRLRSIDSLRSGYRSTAIRFAVAVLSYLAVIGGAILSGTEVDMATTETFVQTFLVFLGSSGAYFFVKKPVK